MFTYQEYMKNSNELDQNYYGQFDMITYQEYMKNSSELYQKYYEQFITNDTIEFVKTRIGVEKLKKSEDLYFNDIISLNGSNAWIWDFTPFDVQLMRECGGVNANSPSCHTCVGKACARMLLNQENENNS